MSGRGKSPNLGRSTRIRSSHSGSGSPRTYRARESGGGGHHDNVDNTEDGHGHPQRGTSSTPQSIPGTSPKSSPFKKMSVSPQKEDNSLVFDTKLLLNMLECPACHLVPSSPPIYMCQDGHNVCGECRGDPSTTEETNNGSNDAFKCPKCNQAVAEARNFLAEGLLDKLKIKCPNAKDGCPELIQIQNKKIHLALCHYRAIYCNQKQEKDCFNVITCYSNYIKHMKKVHKINGCRDTKLQVVQQGLSLLTNLDIPMAAEAWPINYIETFDKTFLTGTEIADEKIFWWVSLFGPQEEAEKYIGKITLFNKALDAEMSYSGPVNEFRRSPAIILEEGTGLIVTNSSFRQFTFLRMCDVADPMESSMRWSVIFSVAERKEPHGFQCEVTDSAHATTNGESTSRKFGSPRRNRHKGNNPSVQKCCDTP